MFRLHDMRDQHGQTVGIDRRAQRGERRLANGRVGMVNRFQERRRRGDSTLADKLDQDFELLSVGLFEPRRDLGVDLFDP